MERLTRRMCGGWGVVPGYELNTIKGTKAVVDRLASYEETELTPEEIVALAEEVNTWKSGYYELLKTARQGISMLYESIRKVQGMNKQESEG